MEYQDKLDLLKKLQNGSDIRGVALATDGKPANLNAEEAAALTCGFVRHLETKTGKPATELSVAVGTDSRITGPFLKKVLLETLEKCGVSALDCGMASTPAMFMATKFEDVACNGAVMITASHLPSPRNGFKYFDQDGGLQKADITAIIEEGAKVYEPGAIAETQAATVEAVSSFTEGATHTPADYGGDPKLMDCYTAHLRQLIRDGLLDVAADIEKPLAGLHIVVDAGNGAGGFYASRVLEPLGADISYSRYLEPDGTFPNHEPNPENKEAMADISENVVTNHADFGLIFDTDVDRSAAVTGSGRPIARNGIVALAAILIAPDNPGATVVTDSITSVQLTDFLEGKLGLSHLRFRRGYKNVINKALELNEQGTNCPLAIETSGHAALRENYFLDDGAYLATKIVIKAAELKSHGQTLDDLLTDLTEPAEAVEYRLPITAEDFGAVGDKVLADLEAAVTEAVSAPAHAAPLYPQLVTPNYEGVRIDFFEASECNKDSYIGWALLRKSLHDPLLPLNIESDVAGGADRIRDYLKSFLRDYPDLDLSVL